MEKNKRQLKREKTSNYKVFRINPLLKLLKLIEKKQKSPQLVNVLFFGGNSLLVLVLFLNELFGDFFYPVFRLLTEGYSFTTVLFFSLLLYFMPIIAILIGRSLKNNSVLKLKILFGLEIPILLITIIWQEMLYELNLSMSYLFLLFFVLILIYSIQIFIPSLEKNKKYLFVKNLRKLLMFVFAVYFSAQIIFTTTLYGVTLLKSLVTDYIYYIGYIFIILVSVIIFLFVFNPVLFVFRFSLQSFKDVINGFSQRWKLGFVFTVFVLFSMLYLLNIENQGYIYLELENEPSLIKQKEMFFNNTDKLKEELQNSATISYYYLGSVQNNSLSNIVGDGFNLNSSGKNALQFVYNLIMYPFFYQDTDKMIYDVEYEAEYLYEQFFDQSINYFDKQYENYDHWSSYADVNIDKQEIEIKEYGDFAEIEICETYSTKSRFTEEIAVYFALPYNSVVIGLWISDDKNIDKKHPGLVAPSGAAEKVYENEVRKQVDPALLSQIGQNEYLLRAFPIMSRERILQDTTVDNDFKNNYQFRLWYRYKTFISDNNWLLPKLIHKRNLKWSDDTQTFINGEITNCPNNWLPEFVASTNPTQLEEHSATISDSLHIISIPIDANEVFRFDNKIAFLIDGSFSMNKSRKKIIDKLSGIREVFPNFKEIDCFVVGKDIYELKAPNLLDELNNNPELFFGNTGYMDMLKNFTSKYKGYANVFESVILISDISEYRYPLDGIIRRYDEQIDTLSPKTLACPFIIFQLSEENYPVEQNDFFNQLIYKSKGGFVNNMHELISLLNVTCNHLDSLVAYQDGIAYFKSKISARTDTLFKDFATKEFINNYWSNDSTKLTDIDLMNEMAKKERIVTKYSSMVALVNQEQIDSLKSAEAHLDRYNNFRETNSSNDGIMGLLDMFGPMVPKYSENVVVFMLFSLVCLMIFTDRFKSHKKNISQIEQV